MAIEELQGAMEHEMMIPDGEYCDGCPFCQNHLMYGLVHCEFLNKVVDGEIKECGINV